MSSLNRQRDPLWVAASVIAEDVARAGVAKRATPHAPTMGVLEPQPPAMSFTVEGEVLEVLGGYGLAHVRTSDGSTYGLNRGTPGIDFAELHEGQRVRVEVAAKFHRVLNATMLA